MSEQTMVLAEPTREERAAMALATSGYECPECYWAAREAEFTAASAVQTLPPRTNWPTRMRWLGDVEQPCRTCGRQTYWCSAGPWEPGKSPR